MVGPITEFPYTRFGVAGYGVMLAGDYGGKGFSAAPVSFDISDVYLTDSVVIRLILTEWPIA